MTNDYDKKNPIAVLVRVFYLIFYKHSLTMSLHVPGLICPCTGPGVIFSASIVINVSPSSPVSLGVNRKHLKIPYIFD